MASAAHTSLCLFAITCLRSSLLIFAVNVSKCSVKFESEVFASLIAISDFAKELSVCCSLFLQSVSSLCSAINSFVDPSELFSSILILSSCSVNSALSFADVSFNVMN